MSTEIRASGGPSEAYDSSYDLRAWINENYLRQGSVYWASMFGKDILVVSDPAWCEYILRTNWRNYVRDGQIVRRMSMLLGRGLVGSNGDLWVRQRRMIQPLFSKLSLEGLLPLINAVNQDWLQGWQLAARRGESVNVTRDVSRLVLETTLRAIFGTDYNDVAPHFEILAADPERDLAFVQKFGALRELVLEIADRRRRTDISQSDFLAGLLRARDRDSGKPMSDPQLVSEVMTLIVGGHETTASLLNWMWYLLASHPDVQARLSEEFERLPWTTLSSLESLQPYVYTRQVIDEVLRLYPSVWLMNRKAIGADQIGDYSVPAGTEIYISPYVIQRSPYLWDVPDRFDPDRMSPNKDPQRHELAHCPFGAGPRNCIGESLARIEVQIHLMLFARDLALQLRGPTSVEIDARIHLLSRHEFVMWPLPKS